MVTILIVSVFWLNWANYQRATNECLTVAPSSKLADLYCYSNPWVMLKLWR